MAHWCFQLLCILKTRMSWKSLCLLFFISTKNVLLSRKEIRMGDVAARTLVSPLLEFAMRMVSAALCCLRVTAPLHSYTLNIVTLFHPLFTSSSYFTKPFLSSFSEEILTRSPLISPSGHSVFLILTKINLLFSHWILKACKCCDSYIQRLFFQIQVLAV